MARNKYPEVTVEKILDVSKRLFLEKGYDGTTIQDIVNELGGLTKGAIYHHFKSKEEIMDALGDQLFFERNPFAEVKRRKDLNGLQKMREVIKSSHRDAERLELSRQSIPIMKNPRILAEMIETDRQVIAPLWLELIEEGNRDGSIHTVFAKELSELLQLLSQLWLSPSIYPATAEEMKHKLLFMRELLQHMGLPLFDDELAAMTERYLLELTKNDQIKLP